MNKPTLRGLDLESHLRDPARKQAYVTTMFDIIAPRYDQFTRWFSYGMDRSWKRGLIDAVVSRIPADARIVDLACGTGDIAFSLGSRLPGAIIVGVDAAPEMVVQAQRSLARRPSDRISFQVGDMMSLPFADGSQDAVTIGYGLRNVPDFHGALREIVRVLKPGGVVACLDFARPSSWLWRKLFLGYLAILGSLYGWWWHGEADVYRYIGRSIDHFVSWRALSRAMADAGLEVVLERPRLFGGVCLHVGIKKSGVRSPESGVDNKSAMIGCPTPDPGPRTPDILR
ncbi:MAG: ubiquinone/menaquinone biosynthesis methyltransferase [Planctomycetes bacterium]|nr:ubiquinone/menaquinone biosynthesis methyltransferase [Planctomycetota bacterium]